MIAKASFFLFGTFINSYSGSVSIPRESKVEPEVYERLVPNNRTGTYILSGVRET